MGTNRTSTLVLALLASLVAFPAIAGDGITKHYVDVSGGQIHYVTAGEGDVVLLLHQAPLSHAEFLPTIPLLAEHFRVVAWDAPGHGSSFIPGHEYEFPEYLAALEELVDALGIERISIVGNHSGASFAREYAARHPDRVGKIILSGSARTPPDPETTLDEAEAFLSQPYSREIPLDTSGDFLSATWDRYLTLASPDADLDDVLVPFIIGLDARTKPYDMHLAIFGYDGWTDYRTIETPVMLLCGDGDIFVNQERIDYTCTLFPNCEVHPFIEGAGAFIGLERPEAFAEAIVEFLTRPEPGS
ncbi:MAG: alpha/beta hydrolase [Candidatus Sulfomarinibacteraceae bacterium]